MEALKGELEWVRERGGGEGEFVTGESRVLGRKGRLNEKVGREGVGKTCWVRMGMIKGRMPEGLMGRQSTYKG